MLDQQILSILAEFTGSLQPETPATFDDLRAARFAMALSILSGESVEQSTAPLDPDRLSNERLDSYVRSEIESVLADARSSQAVPSLVFRREVPVISSLHPAAAPASVAGMAPTRTLGPFTGAAGRRYWFDIYHFIQQITITRTPEAAPFLSVPIEISPHPLPSRFPLGAGSLWFQSQLLAGSSPSGAWSGLKISGGELLLSAPPVIVAGRVEISPATVVTLNLKLDFVATQSGGTGAGGDARAVVAQLPAEVTLVFAPGGGEVKAASDAQLTLYGVTAAMKKSTAVAAYDPELRAIVVPFTPNIAAFTPGPAESDIFQPAGTAPLAGAGWALPVAVTAPSMLGHAAGAGSLVLIAQPGLTASWRGLDGAEVALNRAIFSASAGAILLHAPAAANSRVRQEFELWDEATPAGRRASLEVLYPHSFALLFFSVSSSGTVQNSEILFTFGTVEAHIDRPLKADGTRLGPRMQGWTALFKTFAGIELLVFAAPPSLNNVPPPIPFALHNALMVATPPQALILTGFLGAGNSVDRGGLLLSFFEYLTLPTLPDPYAANFFPFADRQPFPAASGGSFSLGQSPVYCIVLWLSPASPNLSFHAPTLASLALRLSVATPTPDPAASSTDQRVIEDQQNLALMRHIFDQSVESGREVLLLLDVSTNADQFGVGLGFGRLDDAAATPALLTISGLDLVASGANVRAFTVPQIQWEPVINIPNPETGIFPSPVAFWDDGGPTLLGSNTVNLVPLAPVPVIDQIVTTYESGASTAAALFTLPFGIKAVTALPPPLTDVPLIFFPRPSLTYNQPAFAPQNLKGGLQVTLSAAQHLIVEPDSESATLPGAAIQLRNLVDTNGFPFTPDVSILGDDVDPTFNDEFGPGHPKARVPLTRIDFSGYGASTFSDWVNPKADPPAVVQARFDVMVGRTAYEVVKIKSILYPWGAVVVRTITIERVANAEVLRHDSGWVAATPGVFRFPGITVHPGEVLGMYSIRHIRDTSQLYTGSDGVELRAVYFDADCDIADVIRGARDGRVPAVGQLGYVLTKPLAISTPLIPAELNELITRQGPLGGPVDCVLNVGSSGLEMRVTHIEVGNAVMPGGTQQFAAVARGSVLLPRQGSWSIVQRTDSLSEPQSIDPNLGIPLIRLGEAGMSGPNTNPYRFAETADLWFADTPVLDYCFLHSTTAARTVFPRPKIESDSTQITSTVTPLLADAYALLEAVGILPRQDRCIPFQNSNYSLQISGPGLFTLALANNPFPVTLGSRVLADSSPLHLGVEYFDENGAPTEVNVAISPTGWSITMSDLAIRLDMDPFDGLMRALGNLTSSNTSAPSLANSRLAFGSILQPVQAIVSVLEALGFPAPMLVTLSNETFKYKLKAGLQFNVSIQAPIGKLAVGLKVGFGNSASNRDAILTASSQWLMYTGFKGSLQVPVFPGVFAGGVIVFKMEGVFASGSSPASTKLTLQAGVIISVGGDLIPGVLHLEASVTYGYQLVIVTTPPRSIGLGLMLILAANGKVLSGLVGISFSAEADAVLILQSSPCQLTAQATFDAQLEITLGWFLDITFDAQAQYQKSVSC